VHVHVHVYVFRAASAAAFLLNPHAVEMLGQVTQLVLDGPGAEQTGGV